MTQMTQMKKRARFAPLTPARSREVHLRNLRIKTSSATAKSAAMARKDWMKPLADDEIPIVRASVAKAQVGQ